MLSAFSGKNRPCPDDPSPHRPGALAGSVRRHRRHALGRRQATAGASPGLGRSAMRRGRFAIGSASRAGAAAGRLARAPVTLRLSRGACRFRLFGNRMREGRWAWPHPEPWPSASGRRWPDRQGGQDGGTGALQRCRSRQTGKRPGVTASAGSGRQGFSGDGSGSERGGHRAGKPAHDIAAQGVKGDGKGHETGLSRFAALLSYPAWGFPGELFRAVAGRCVPDMVLSGPGMSGRRV